MFRSFKTAWNEEMKKYTRSSAGCKLEKNFFVVFNPAFQRSMTVANAQGAFRGSGIFPFNPSAIPDHAFAPSLTTERADIPPAIVSSDAIMTTPITSSANSVSAALQSQVMPFPNLQLGQPPAWKSLKLWFLC